MNAAKLIEYIRTAEKKTPVKVYLWERSPTSFPNARVFPAGDGTKIVFGDWGGTSAPPSRRSRTPLPIS